MVNVIPDQFFYYLRFPLNPIIYQQMLAKIIINSTARHFMYDGRIMSVIQPGYRVLSILALLLIGQLSLAGGETTKSPILDRVEVIHKAPENLEALSMEELEIERSVRMRHISAIKQVSDKPDVARQKLLKTILEHDDKRLQIADVIAKLVDEYQIEGALREALLGYRETFNTEMRDARKYVQTLDDYKSYDFRFSAVYMSMLFKFNESPQLHKRLVADMGDENTTIGKYRQELDESYAKIERDKWLLQDLYSINELEQAIAAIDKEISQRKHTEL